jgi:hypothetical protein
MSADASPRFDALKALLTSAQELAQAIESDPTIRRVLRALASLPPEDREILATVLERAAASRRINESVMRMNGVHLRMNPNPRLFVRVIDADAPPEASTLEEEEDLLPDVLLLLRRLGLLLAPGAHAALHSALVAALDMLSAQEREDCRRFVDDVAALVSRILPRDDGSRS